MSKSLIVAGVVWNIHGLAYHKGEMMSSAAGGLTVLQTF